MGTAHPSTGPGRGGFRWRGAVLPVVVWLALQPSLGIAQITSPQPFEIHVRIARADAPPTPQPFTIRVEARRAEPPSPPEPFTIALTVSRAEPAPSPEAFTIHLTVSRSMPDAPAPFPVRVTVARQSLPEPPAPLAVRVTVVRQPLPPPPAPFAVQVTVARQPLPEPPTPFPVQVTVARQPLPPPPAPFAVQVTVARQPLPLPPAPFAVQVKVVRLEIGPEVEELLENLRRLEASSTEQAVDAAELAAAITRRLQAVDQALSAAGAEIDTALRFLDAGEGELERLGTLGDAALAEEAAIAAALLSVGAVAAEVCALDPAAGSSGLSPLLIADLERKVDAAGASVDDIVVAREKCGRSLDELKASISDWASRWETQIQGARAAVEVRIRETGALLEEAIAAAEELGPAVIGLGEIEAEAESVSEEIERRVAEWASPALAGAREEILGEKRRLAEAISSRVVEALDGHDLQLGEIETAHNDLDLVVNDLDGLGSESSRRGESARSQISTLLAETRATVERAAEGELRAGEAVSEATGCLDRILTRADAGGAESSISVPDLTGKSEAMATAWLEDLGLRAFVQSGDSTLDEGQIGKVSRQDPAAGASLRPGEAVSIWTFASAARQPPRTEIPALTQAVCDADWPGTLLVTELGGGNPRCECPAGTAWSQIRNGCLGLEVGSGVPGGSPTVSRDCSHRPGTVFDSRTGQCLCPLGTWNGAVGRCIDAAVAERQKAIDNARSDAGCEYLLSRIRTFRQHPSSVHRQMASSAEAKARSMGCDQTSVEDAVAEGDRRVWTPPAQRPADEGAAAGPAPSGRDEDLDRMIRAGVGLPESEGTGPPPQGTPTEGPADEGAQAPPDCSHCEPYSDWLETNAGPCGYHPLRLPSICELDPECVHWAGECVSHQRQLDRCLAECYR